MSPEFGEGETIAEKFRCSRDDVDKPGVNVSPRLSWSCGPEGTQSYAVTMIHVGSQTLHWVLWDIPASVRELPEGVERLPEPPVPAGSKQNEPDVDGSTWYGYSGPCPGSPNQSYTFFVYALDVATLPGVTTESTPLEVDAVIKAHDLAVETLTGGGSP
jgi:Raf kinase inhibitor-like YbhB/YbcL family protein